MKLLDSDETVVLVTGTSEGAVARDRPLALHLQREIDNRGAGHTYRRAIVVGDEPYLERPQLHGNPTITIGGPGSNGVAQQFAGELPTLWQDNERVFVQADLEGEIKRVALWGADAASTAAAVDAFVGQGFLDLLLERIWRLRVSQSM